MEALGQLFSDGGGTATAGAGAGADAAAGQGGPKKQQHVRWGDQAAAAAAGAAAGVAAADDEAVTAGAEEGPLAGGYGGAEAGGHDPDAAEAALAGDEPWGGDGALGGYGDESAAYGAESAGHVEGDMGVGHDDNVEHRGVDGEEGDMDGAAGLHNGDGAGDGGGGDGGGGEEEEAAEAHAADGDETEYHDVNGVQYHVEAGEEHYNEDGAGEAVWGGGGGADQLYGADGIDPDDQYIGQITGV
ncbi:unnamed protein product [Closterium sp. Naga37s-1]|nr:unnamed protein product [Closterium sp. Naga37s-1]